MIRGENEAIVAVDDVESLAAAFQQGDSAAFDELVVLYKDRMYNLCYRFLGVHADAEDAAQDVFMKVYTSIPRFRFQSSFSTWLYRIAVNVCKNRLKSFSWRHIFSFIADKDDAIADIADIGPSPDKQLEKVQLSRAVEKAIAGLPVEQRLVVVLRDIEGLSYEDISTVTGFNQGTVKSKLSRARHALRDKLKGMV